MRKKVYSGVYACPVCDDEFELKRASGSELECPDCGEQLEPTEDKEDDPEMLVET
jgi:transcription initiation factor IIE alpha subunit